jgi:hypothetical protein
MNAWAIIAGIAGLAVLYVMLPLALAARTHFRDHKLVHCPVIGLAAGVRIRRAGLAEAVGCRALRRVVDCTFWPRHRGCAQSCRLVPDDEIRDFRRWRSS